MATRQNTLLYYSDLKMQIINALLCSVVTYVPTVLQEKVLAEQQEAPSISPLGMELGLDLQLDLEP